MTIEWVSNISELYRYTLFLIFSSTNMCVLSPQIKIEKAIYIVLFIVMAKQKNVLTVNVNDYVNVVNVIVIVNDYAD